jgi:hypothetical protein
MKTLKEEIEKILEDERIGDVNRSKAQATAIVEWLDHKKMIPHQEFDGCRMHGPKPSCNDLSLEVERLTKELEEARAEVERLNRKMDGGSNCNPKNPCGFLACSLDAEKAMISRNKGLEAALAAMKNQFIPGDWVYVAASGAILHVKIESMDEEKYRATWKGALLHIDHSKAYATADECRENIPVEEST